MNIAAELGMLAVLVASIPFRRTFGIVTVALFDLFVVLTYLGYHHPAWYERERWPRRGCDGG